MSGQDAELEQLRAGVSCAVLLERNGYQVDEKESTRGSQKWRRGAGEIVIVSHEGRGWWDPQRPGNDRTGKGDVFTLTQYLDPRLNFGQVRKILRGMVGLTSSCPAMERQHERMKPAIPVALRWEARHRLSQGSATWGYLTGERCLPAGVLVAADLFGVVREGPRGSAWFASTDHAGVLTGFDMRGPDWRSFSKDGDKCLFRLPGGTGVLTRLAVCEAPIDALSLAALEGLRPDTLYVSTSGGMGPLTITGLELLLQGLAAHRDGVLVQATDNDPQGDRYAGHLAELARAAGVRSERLLPPGGLADWNDVIKKGRGS